MTASGLGESLVLSFDGSVLYGPKNARPTAASVGYVVTAGKAIAEGSHRLSAFVSSTHVEYRALVAGARAVAAIRRHRDVVSLHVRGDAAAVIQAVDPTHPARPGDDVRRRRVETVRDLFAPIPEVTYRKVGRDRNRRADQLATRAHGTDP
jgi:ribonuclease HI